MNAVLEPCIAFLPMKPADLDEVLAIECRVCPFPWGRGNFTDSMASGYTCKVCRVDGELKRVRDWVTEHDCCIRR